MTAHQAQVGERHRLAQRVQDLATQGQRLFEQRLGGGTLAQPPVGETPAVEGAGLAPPIAELSPDLERPLVALEGGPVVAGGARHRAQVVEHRGHPIPATERLEQRQSALVAAAGALEVAEHFVDPGAIDQRGRLEQGIAGLAGQRQRLLVAPAGGLDLTAPVVDEADVAQGLGAVGEVSRSVKRQGLAEELERRVVVAGQVAQIPQPLEGDRLGPRIVQGARQVEGGRQERRRGLGLVHPFVQGAETQQRPQPPPLVAECLPVAAKASTPSR